MSFAEFVEDYYGFPVDINELSEEDSDKLHELYFQKKEEEDSSKDTDVVEQLLATESLSQEKLRSIFLGLSEETAEIISVDIVKEPKGEGLHVKQSDGHVYKYTADEDNAKYSTLDSLKKTVDKLLKFRSSGFVLGWLGRNAILYDGSKKKVSEGEEKS